MRSRVASALMAIATGLVPVTAAAEPLDEAAWAAILERYTREVPDTARTRVDYRGLAAAAEWRALVAQLERTRPDALADRAQRLAYWINVYNILAIEVVLRASPVESIRDAGSLLRPVWRREAGRIGGRTRTLHEIEHEILRPMGDPRIHFAIVCASVSCPALRREPWTAARIEAQLDDALRAFLADPEKGLALDRSRHQLKLSRIFDWFEDDFEPEGGVLAYATRNAPPDERAWLEAHRSTVELDYLHYDWKLNDLAGARPGG